MNEDWNKENIQRKVRVLRKTICRMLRKLENRTRRQRHQQEDSRDGSPGQLLDAAEYRRLRELERWVKFSLGCVLLKQII